MYKRCNQKNLYNYVPKFACKWRDVGIQLLKARYHNALDIIERNCRYDVEECCKKMIDKWLETDKNAKWSQLIKALVEASVSLITLANEIKESTKDNLEDDDNDDDDDEEEEEEEEDGDNDDSEHGGSYSNIIRTSSFGELEVEFVKMTDKIKNALIKKNIDVGSLIEQLSAMSTVRDKKVPLFDENVFETVKTVEDLWRRLRNYWSIRDYDILIFVLKIVECEEANDIYKEFLSRIDSSILKDIEFVLSCKEYKGEGLKEHLEVKLGVESLTVKIKKQAEEAISKVYNLEKYALTFKSIKEGCIELTYGISKALKSYLLQFQVTEDDFIYFSACNIVHLQICDKRLKIPSQVIDKDEVFVWTSHQQDAKFDELPAMKKIKLEESTVTISEHLVPVTDQATTEDNKKLPQIEQEITCLICGDFFTNPITLSCSHTFCKQCIKNNLQKNINIACCCPLCCKIVLQDDVESISINFNIKKLVEVFKKEAETKCGNCEKESLLVVWCIECNNMYCQNCNEIHIKWKDFREHRIIDFMQSSLETCNTHFKPMDYYCKTCNNVICQECALKNHCFEMHDVGLIDTVVSKERENIKNAAALLEQLLEQARSKVKMLEDHENLVDDKSKVNIEQTKSSFGKMHTLLTCREEEVLKTIDSNKLSLKQMLAMQKSNVALLEIQLEGCKGFAENIVTANSTQQILLYHHWIMKRVNHLAEQIRNIYCDLQSHKHISTAVNAKSVEYTSPLYYINGFLRLPHCNIHVCTPVVKPKQVKLIVTLKDTLGYPLMYQSSNMRIYCNMEDNFLQNIQVKEQPDSDGVYHIYYNVIKKINHLIFVYLGDILVNHEKIEVSVNTRDYVSINKSEVKIIKNGLPETPLKFPYSLAKGPNNQLIFADDSTSQLVIFDDQLQYSRCIGKRGKEDGEFLNITGIAIDNYKQLYVADSDLNCIQKFKLDGQFIYKFGSYGSDNGQFDSPHGLLVCHSKLFVCDRHNHRIQIFIREEWSYTIGQQGTEPGSFKEPVDLSLSNNEDQIFVTDNKNHRVQVFTLDGQFLRVFGNLKGIPSTLQKNPVGIFVTSDGYVLITCCHHTGCIMVLDEDGTFVSAIEGSYQGKRRFNHPCGIVMMDNGQIVIACNLSSRLVVL